MRFRAFAYAILLFSALDLVVLAVAPVLGWLPSGAESGTGTVVILALAFLLAFLAMIGSISVLATDFEAGFGAFSWDANCGECGRSSEPAIAFCHHCGAAA